MNIKKLLKSGAKDVLPDEKIKEDIKLRVGIEGDEREAELGGIKAKIKNNKKTCGGGSLRARRSDNRVCVHSSHARRQLLHQS